MRRVVVLLLVAVLGAAPAEIATATTEACADGAHVSWDVDLDLSTVTGATVEAGDCPDGELLGLQLVTDRGEVPADPLFEVVDAGRAHFDLSAHAPGIEPTTGVRVFVHPSTGVGGDEVVRIVVERWFFTADGEPRPGLHDVDVVEARVGEAYVVADAGSAYRVVACTSVGVAVGADAVGEGPGTYTATRPGRHPACFRMHPGAGDDATGDDGQVAGVDRVLGVPTPASPGRDLTLARTGVPLEAAGLLALSLLAAGAGAVLAAARSRR